MNDFSDYRQRVDSRLQTHLKQCNAQTSLQAAMTYSVFNGGKRIRPILVYATTEALGGNLEQADSSACAVELIHCYSLVHDDLPAMDNDDLRRGKPTTHIKFDEATAILAGDALQALAFEVLSFDGENSLRKIRQLAVAAGANGMVGGQMIDVTAVNTPSSANTIEAMHLLKTGALIKASVLMATCDDSPTDPQLAGLTRFAHKLGLAFQIKDDLLDVLGEQDAIGKPVGADEFLNKPTYVSIHGVEGSQAILSELHDEAMQALEEFDSRADRLRSISDFVVLRNN